MRPIEERLKSVLVKTPGDSIAFARVITAVPLDNGKSACRVDQKVIATRNSFYNRSRFYVRSDVERRKIKNTTIAAPRIRRHRCRLYLGIFTTKPSIINCARTAP